MILRHTIFYLLLLSGIACTYTIKIKDGQTAYERKQYHTAIPMLQKEAERAKTRTERGKIAYKIGDAYRRTGQSEAALQWFNKAYQDNYGPEAMKAAAYELKKLERYPEAKETFKNLGIEIGSPYEFRKELTACDVSADWKKQAPGNGWTIVPAPFNSAQNDFSPVRYADGRTVFTSDRLASTGKEDYHWTGNKFMDLFIVDPESASPQSFSHLNTDGNEGTVCFNNTYDEVYVVRAAGAYPGDDAFCKIYVSTKQNEYWEAPQPLFFQKEKINYLHPALSADGQTLFYACNDPEGWGGFDLYSVQRNPKSEIGWNEPRLLTRSLNTAGNELFPVIDKDTLYFASDGLPGMGGLDIFRTYKLDRNTWAPPVNLKAPVNSGSDDFAFTVEKRHSAEKQAAPGTLLSNGYLSSNRPGGRGGDDIYRYELRVPPPAPVKKDTAPTGPVVYKIVLEGYVLEKIFSEPGNPNSAMLGRKPLGGARVQIDAGGKKHNVTVADDGYFTLELADNTDYFFVASREGYLNNSARFSTRGMAKVPSQPVQTYEVEIVLDKIYRNLEIVLENIYYDYDKWDIRPDAEPTLNRLAEVLKQNPAIRIELGSHTDCRGNDTYNEDLSQKRAQSAVNYLIGKGIAADRLLASGFGESQPAVECLCARCSEAEHQANRRTTFRILE